MAYHKAKADGSNPELVKAVEDLLGKPSTKIDRPLEITLKDGSVVRPTEIGGSTTFYHASSKKRQGRLVPNTAPQWGKAVYFALNRQSAVDEFGENVTEAMLNLKNPLYTNTRDNDAVDKKAAELYNREMLPEILRDQAELVNGQWKFFDEYWQAEYDKNGYIDWYSASDVEEGKYFGEAAIELGYDAIIDPGGQYGTEIAVLDESSIIYPEDIISTSSRPSGQAAMGRPGGVSQDTILDAMDEIDNAIESGVSAEQAIQENILSQPWYGQLSDDQKTKVDSVINTEYGVNPSEIVTASESAQKLEDLYNSQEKGYKNKIQDLLADDPELKYIYNNIPKILSALEQEGVIKKNKNCP
jgi:hypothetical protein